MLVKDKLLVDDIVDFIIKYGHYNVPREFLEQLVRDHEKYETAMLLFDGDEIIALARWNIPSPDTLEVLDCIIHPKYRGKEVVLKMLRTGLAKHWWITKITWKREFKYPDRTPRVYKGLFFARGKEKGNGK